MYLDYKIIGFCEVTACFSYSHIIVIMMLHKQQCFELYIALPTWQTGGDVSCIAGEELIHQENRLNNRRDSMLLAVASEEPSIMFSQR